MRSVFYQFPEVLLIDATHGTNASKCKVFSFMTHDAFGKGQFVQHAAVQNERRETLLTAMEAFKESNPSWTKVQCVLIDKDFTEMSVLKTAFPDATILLCQFHVIKYLREEIASSDYGFTAWQKQQLRNVVNLLVYAKTEQEYEKHLKYMWHLVSFGLREATPRASSAGGVSHAISSTQSGLQSRSVGRVPDSVGRVPDSAVDEVQHPFEWYFSKNWDGCRHLWCSYKRQNAVTLGNNTNNRLESWWKQLKEVTSVFMGLDECVAAIMCYQSQEEKLFMDRVFKLTVVQDPKYDREMAHLANLVSEHACELIYEQYTYAVSHASYTYYMPVPDVIFLSSTSSEEDAPDEPRQEYSVNKRNWECSCLFMTTRLLPCQHVFFLRRALGLETVIPTQLLHPRWLLSSVRSKVVLEDFSSAAFAVGDVIRSKDTPWDSDRKYREASRVASAISDTMSGFGMSEYRVALKALHQVARLFKHRQFAGIAGFSQSFLLDSDAEGAEPCADEPGVDQLCVVVACSDTGRRIPGRCIAFATSDLSDRQHSTDRAGRVGRRR